MQELDVTPQSTKQYAPNVLGLHYSWIIAALAFFTLLVSAGIRSTPGVLIVPLENYFNWERTEITFALAINLALYGLGGPFSAALMERYGVRKVTVYALLLLVFGTGLSTWMTTPWQLTLLWGILIGIGTGFSSSVLGAMVANRWFIKHKGLVVGILSASGAAGQLIFLPILAKAVEVNGWQMAIWLTTISAFIIAIFVMIFMRNKPADLSILPYGATKAVMDNPKHAASISNTNPFKLAFNGLFIGIKRIEFWILSGSFFVCGASTNGLIGTHFIPAAAESGFSEVVAASLLAIIGIFNIIGTTLSGWLSDRYDNRWLLFFYYGFRGISLLFLPYALGSTYISLTLFIIFYGLDWVATVPPTIRLTSEIFGQHGGIVFGWIFAIHQVGAAFAAYGGGFLHTKLHNYNLTFIISGVLCLVAAILVLKLRKTTPINAS
jgi:MFS family permease